MRRQQQRLPTPPPWLPQLQQRLSFRQVLVQVAWLAAGLGLVMAATSALHVH